MRESRHPIEQLQSYEIRDSLSPLVVRKSHLAAVSLIVGVGLVYLLFQGTYGLEIFGSYGLPLFMAAAATLGLLNYLRMGKSPFSYVSLGFALGLVSWALGLAAYTYVYYVAYSDVPYISMLDVFYLGSYPPMIWGAIGLLKLLGKSLKKAEWAAVAVSGTALTILMIPYVFIPSIEGLTSWDALVAIIYPVMDNAVFLLLLPLFFAFRKGVAGLSFALIAFGAALFTLGDMALTYVSLTSGYYDGHPLDLLLFSGCIIVGYGFWNRNSDLKSIDFGKHMNGKSVRLDLGTHCVYCNLDARDQDACRVCRRISKKLFRAEPSYTGCLSSRGSPGRF